MDKFKQYLQEHSTELDAEEPGARVWKNIRDNQMVTKPSVTILSVIRYAAAACILALAGIGIWHIAANQTKEVVAIVKQKIDTIRGVQNINKEKDSVNVPMETVSVDTKEQLKVNNREGADAAKTADLNNHTSGKKTKICRE